MKDLIIYGAGPQTEQFLSELKYFGEMKAALIAVDSEYKNCDSIYGLELVSFDHIEKEYSPDSYEMLVIGSYGVPRLKKEMYEKAKGKGYTLINYVSPGCDFGPDIVMGDNNIIYRGVDLGFGGRMGSNNIIRQKSYVGHQIDLGSHTVISPGCIIGGHCKIGDLCWIGLGATIRDQSIIGNEVLVGMSAVVTRNIEDYATAIGFPAKVVAHHPDTGVTLRNQRKNEIK